MDGQEAGCSGMGGRNLSLDLHASRGRGGSRTRPIQKQDTINLSQVIEARRNCVGANRDLRVFLEKHDVHEFFCCRFFMWRLTKQAHSDEHLQRHMAATERKRKQ